MALEVTCSRHTWGTQLHLRQSGYEEGVRWRRYYELIGPGWNRALESLKKFDGPAARSGEMLTITMADCGATSERETSISPIFVIVSATSPPRSQMSGTTPHASASWRAIASLPVAA